MKQGQQSHYVPAHAAPQLCALEPPQVYCSSRAPAQGPSSFRMHCCPPGFPPHVWQGTSR